MEAQPIKAVTVLPGKWTMEKQTWLKMGLMAIAQLSTLEVRFTGGLKKHKDVFPCVNNFFIHIAPDLHLHMWVTMLTAIENHVFLTDTARFILLHFDAQDKLYGDVLMNGGGWDCMCQGPPQLFLTSRNRMEVVHNFITSSLQTSTQDGIWWRTYPYSCVQPNAPN